MGALGIWLAAVGLADLCAGASGEIASRSRAALGVSVSGVTAGLLGALADYPAWWIALLVAITVVGTSAWLGARLGTAPDGRRAAVIFVGAALALGVFVVSAAAWPDVDGGALQRLVERLPYDAIKGQSWDRVLAMAGVLVFLQATGNAVVRLVLAMSGTPASAEQRLRGGRFIGPMERTLIFALGLAGYLTAAAIVATAKGLLRFPEISREGQPNIHEATEYFLVGSLASWMLALAPLTLL